MADTVIVITDEQKNRLKEKVKELLSKYVDDDNCYRLYPTGYGDYLSESILREWFDEYLKDKNNIKDYGSFKAFAEYKSDELFYYADEDMLDGLKRTCDREFKDTDLESAYRNLEASFEVSSFYDFIREECGYNGVTIDIEDYLTHNYHFNILFMADCEYYTDKSSQDSKDDTLTDLIKGQGYTPEQVIEAYKDLQDKGVCADNKFVDSVAEELYNTTYDYNELTFLVNLSGIEVFDLLDAVATGKGELTFKKNTMCGLFDRGSGSGSVLGIDLKKDATFPASKISGIQIEGAERYNKGITDYTVDNVYGLAGSCWKSNVLSVKAEEAKKKNKGLERE